MQLNPASSPALTRLLTEDYPVFTPTREDGVPGYQCFRSDSRALSDPWAGCTIEEEPTMDSFMRRIQSHKARHMKRDTMSLPDDYLKSPARSWLTDRNGYRDNADDNSAIVVLPVSEAHVPTQLPRKSSKSAFLWRFPRLKKTKKNGPRTPRHAVGYDDASLTCISVSASSFELKSLRNELMAANASREAAEAEASEMRGALDELKQKLVLLETHCRELKKALKHAVLLGTNEPPATLAELKWQGSTTSSKRTSKSIQSSKNRATVMPVSTEVMAEGFLQVTSETRLSVKQFCRVLVEQTNIDGGDGVCNRDTWIEKLDSLLTAQGLALPAVADPRRSRALAYHLESLVNRSLYRDFENCAFHPTGSPIDLDPLRNRQRNFSAFASLRNLSWSDVLNKGGNPFCEEFAGFCDLKVGCLAELLGWPLPWPEQIIETFYVAAKCAWLAHLLAFSFRPPAGILRVKKGTGFDPVYMEKVLLEKCRRPAECPARVEVMVVPGFYLHDRVIKCRVLCSDGSATLHG